MVEVLALWPYGINRIQEGRKRDWLLFALHAVIISGGFYDRYGPLSGCLVAVSDRVFVPSVTLDTTIRFLLCGMDSG